MFTGIIKNKAQFVSLKKYKSKYFLTLNTVQKFTNKDIGSSISINGIVSSLPADWLSAALYVFPGFLGSIRKTN